jgi:hypothetical protein
MLAALLIWVSSLGPPAWAALPPEDPAPWVARWAELSFRQKRQLQMRLDHGEFQGTVALLQVMLEELNHLATQPDPVPDGASVYALNLMRYLRAHPQAFPAPVLRTARIETHFIVAREVPQTNVLALSSEMSAMLGKLNSTILDRDREALERLGADPELLQELQKARLRITLAELAQMRPGEFDILSVVALQTLLSEGGHILMDETLQALDLQGFRVEDLALLAPHLRLRAIRAIWQLQHVYRLDLERKGFHTFTVFYHGIGAPLNFSNGGKHDFLAIFKGSQRTWSDIALETLHDLRDQRDWLLYTRNLISALGMGIEVPADLILLPEKWVHRFVFDETPEFLKFLQQQRGGPDSVFQQFFYEARELEASLRYQVFVQGVLPHYRDYGTGTLKMIFDPSDAQALSEDLKSGLRKPSDVNPAMSLLLTPAQFDEYALDLLLWAKAKSGGEPDSVAGYLMSWLTVEHPRTLQAIAEWGKTDPRRAFLLLYWMNESDAARAIFAMPEYESLVLQLFKSTFPISNFDGMDRARTLKFSRLLRPEAGQQLLAQAAETYHASGKYNEVFELQLRYPETYLDVREPYVLQFARERLRDDLKAERRAKAREARKAQFNRICNKIMNLLSG